MNPTVQRYLPPALVIGAAVFFGWPPSKPLDLGDDVVRATSVRWRVDDLKDPRPIELKTDPFREVLVAQQPIEATSPEDLAAQRPAGPEPEVIQSGLRLDGIANMAGRRWALLNGRPRLEGDSVLTSGNEPHLCKIVLVEPDHVVVRCQETVTEIRPLPFGTARQKTGMNKPSATKPGFTPGQPAAPDPASIGTPLDTPVDEMPPPQV